MPTKACKTVSTKTTATVLPLHDPVDGAGWKSASAIASEIEMPRSLKQQRVHAQSEISLLHPHYDAGCDPIINRFDE